MTTQPKETKPNSNLKLFCLGLIIGNSLIAICDQFSIGPPIDNIAALRWTLLFAAFTLVFLGE